VLEAVQTKQGTLGKLVYEQGIHDNAMKLLDNATDLSRNVRAGKGRSANSLPTITLHAYRQWRKSFQWRRQS